MNVDMSVQQNKPKKERIEILDALRGFAVVLMVCHHFLYDLVVFLDAPEWLFSNKAFDILQPFFAGVFIALCGVSSNFSRSNIKRGIITLGFALGVTAVTIYLEMPIIFGVLHLLACCMLFYGITHRLLEKINGIFLLIICVALVIISAYCVNNIPVQSDKLWILGFAAEDFVSYDYFPLLPWLFVFLSGTVIGRYIAADKFPRWFYKVKIPVLSFIGRHALVIYIVHQPLLYLITLLIKGIEK